MKNEGDKMPGNANTGDIIKAIKHTPGPWFINGPFDHDSDLFIRANVDTENLDIANLSVDETGDFKANAKLIAAAPELLNMLIEITETFKGCLGGSDPLYYEDFKDEIESVEKLIKKATE